MHINKNRTQIKTGKTGFILNILRFFSLDETNLLIEGIRKRETAISGEINVQITNFFDNKMNELTTDEIKMWLPGKLSDLIELPGAVVTKYILRKIRTVK